MDQVRRVDGEYIVFGIWVRDGEGFEGLGQRSDEEMWVVADASPVDGVEPADRRPRVGARGTAFGLLAQIDNFLRSGSDRMSIGTA